MKENIFIQTQNYTQIMELVTRMERDRASSEKLGLVYGNFGVGKTFAIEKILREKNGIQITAQGHWSTKNVLQNILTEIMEPTVGSTNDLFERVCEKFPASGRGVIIVDEADFLIRNGGYGMIEALRGIHDKISIPILLVGMESLRARIQLRPHLYSRFPDANIIIVHPLGIEDISRLAGYSEVVIAEDLLEHIAKTKANFREAKNIIKRCEELCELQDLDSIDMRTFTKLTAGGGR